MSLQSQPNPEDNAISSGRESRPACEVKRIIEIWTSGIYPREEILADPERILGAHHVPVHRDVLEALSNAFQPGATKAAAPAMRNFHEHLEVKLAWRERIRAECAPTERRFRQWRERQIRRCQVEIGENQNHQIVHAPMAFELTKGCSVKCWFCALDAPPLSGTFPHTPENAQLWSDVLMVMGEIVGDAARWGSSYWATEPMDNPDYEAFCEDFHQRLGMYPQTTTAVALRSPERVKRLLRESHAKGCMVNRFSVHTGKQLLRIHQTYTAEELAWTELILQNPESDCIKAHSGRLLNFRERLPEKAAAEERKLLSIVRERNRDLVEVTKNVVINRPGAAMGEGCAEGGSNLVINLPGTTSCITGFITNMVDRTVELISPCTASELWPLGYIVFDRGTFETAADFRVLIEGMIERHMPEEVALDSLIRFAPQLTYAADPQGFRLGSALGSMNCLDESSADYLRCLGDMIHAGSNRAGEIAVRCFYEFSKPEGVTLATLNTFFQHGMLDDAGRRQGEQTA